MAFCGNCGTQMQDGVKFCTACGKETGGPPARQAQPQQAWTGAPGTVPLTTGGKTFKLDTIFILLSGIHVVLLSFLLPYYRITVSNWSGDRTTWVSMFSSIVSGDGRSFSALLAFIVPIAILLMFLFKRKLTFLADKHLLAAAGLCALGIVSSIIFMNVTSSIIHARPQGGSVHAAPTFFIAMLLYLAGIGIAVYGMKAAKNK